MVDFKKLRLNLWGKGIEVASPSENQCVEFLSINGKPVDITTPAGELVRVTGDKFAEAMEHYLASVGEA